MENILLGGLISFVITFYAIPIVIYIADKKKLYDEPDERKIHFHPISPLGGVGIFSGFILGLLIAADISSVAGSVQFILAALMVVFFVGIKDDVLILLPMKKFIGQLIVAFLLMWKGNLLINDMHGFLYINKIDTTYSYALTLFTIVVIMNAFNLIDGIDGLASSLGIITASIFTVFFYLNGDIFFACLGFCLAASLFSFLIYNFSPAKIFMGDAGSMLIGTVNSILVIRFIETAEGSNILPLFASPAMGFGILLIPLMDTLRVFTIRIFHGRSPFFAEKNHLHHLLLEKGFTHKQIMFYLSISSILIILLSYVALPLGTTKVILLQIISFFLGVWLIKKYKSKKQKMHLIIDEESIPIKVRNMVSMMRSGVTAEKD